MNAVYFKVYSVFKVNNTNYIKTITWKKKFYNMNKF